MFATLLHMFCFVFVCGLIIRVHRCHACRPEGGGGLVWIILSRVLSSGGGGGGGGGASPSVNLISPNAPTLLL